MRLNPGQITCEKLVQAYINRIRAYDGMCVAPVNPNDANDPKSVFPDIAKYTGTPLQPGVMQATISDPAKLQTYGYTRHEERRTTALVKHGKYPR